MTGIDARALAATVTGLAAWARPAAGPGTVAGLAVALTATSLTGVLTGSGWWGYVVLTTAVVVAVGVLLRSLRMPPIVVAAGQLAALVGLVTALFTRSGRFGVLPGPTAAAELYALLGGAAEQIRIGVPPVPASTELLCLVVLALGLAAIAVDTLAISAAVPATSGLVLLCVVAVPAALSDQLLPWWSFVLGATGFALLLTVDGQLRHLEWGHSTGRHSTGLSGYFGAAPAAVAVTASAVVVALVVGTVTAVGTSQSSPGIGRQVSGIGLNPFTSLRGQLNAGNVVPLFRVRGLEQRAYLRALTLSRFTNQVGWQQGPLDGAVPASSEEQTKEWLPLPAGVAQPVPGPTVQVQIEPINYVDNWLPTVGYPLVLAGVGQDWDYDPDAITVFSDRRRRAPPYTELGVLPQPDPQLLRAAGPAGSARFATVDRRYLDTGGVDRRVALLATQITAGTRTAFDATVAINQWFTQPGSGFSYDRRTVPGNSGDALVDFLFTGHRGYCEQFASAMAIMLRTLRVPARVAVGFTPGTFADGTRLITTEDAHAWVEVWFPGAGWLPFDPTPLSDGRTVIPGYVAPSGSPPGADPAARPPVAATTPPVPDAVDAAPQLPGAGDFGHGTGSRIGLTIAGLLVLGVLAGLTPLAVREARRRRRLYLVGGGGPQAVSAGWEEVMAESADRGVVPPAGETVRATAQRLADEHTLDEAGQAGLRTLVAAVERSWYGSAAQVPARDTLSPDASARDTDRELRGAVDAVRASFARCAPPTRTAQLLPRSVLHRRR
ncbi:MAG: transglutaminaseTgpA domain-containing protein [Pseudonocardiaceae bacterium]